MASEFSRVDWRSRFGSMAHGLPFLLFAAFPFYGIWSAAGQLSTKAFATVHVVIYLTLFLAGWLLEDFAPVREKPSPWLLALIAVMVAMELSVSLSSSPSYGFMVCYIVPFMMLMPRRFLAHYSITIFLVVLGQTVVLRDEPIAWVALLAVLANLGFVFMVIDSEWRRRTERLARAKQLQRTTEQQRLELAAELHDVLGQQLTAIAMKSAVLNSLLDHLAANPNDAVLAQANTEAEQIQDLARQALSDVRKVVAGSRETNLATEIAAAQVLLAAADIKLDVDWRCAADDITQASAVGRFGPYVIRESCTNVARHAQAATKVQIVIDKQSVSVIDNGFVPKEEPLLDDSGSGLKGLASRVTGFAQLTWGPIPNGRGWQVVLQELAEQESRS